MSALPVSETAFARNMAPAPGPLGIRPPEHRERIVAGGIGARRRHADADVVVEHALKERRAAYAELGARQGAHRVPGERVDDAPPAVRQVVRVLHVGGDEHVAGFAAGDALPEQSRGAEDGVDGDPVRRGNLFRGAAERGAEAARGEKPEWLCQT